MPSVKVFFAGTQLPSKAPSTGNGRKQVFQVKNAVELIAAAKQYKDGDVIYLGPGMFDFTEASVLEFPLKVVLQGTYDLKTQTGTTVFTGRLGHQPVIKLTGKGSKFLNIRMKGPDTSRRTEQMMKLYQTNEYYSIPNSRGISVMGDDITVSGCEFFGWSEAAIYIDEAKGVEVMNNYIHHNQREGLGYGVCLNKSSARIYYNYFDWNRHDIAGTGRTGTCFDAQYNMVGAHKSSHSFDMHKIMDESIRKEIAGDTIIIKNNWVYVKDQEFVRISGATRFYVSIENNQMVNLEKKPIKILRATGREKVVGNRQLKNNAWVKNIKRGDIQ
ncbi:hypothetical protein DLD77_05535 [Chitinophaga alhagiae]|uniref:Periplasmic copper-binding protein NosD beta helix domain-containing protein n=2 Tax=Chitinophaga alhagiae TaxID=2203219 RepID=A0ABM6WAY9_9BACT|nr:right-handed parallel beta-helix repeat-containing protein [Chitinophaga alhagiae]AWO01190.1 hypothetical protein DLD77_05535 [Chitinophaga alhagiae]